METDVKVDELVRVYIKIRDERDTEKRKWEDREKELESQMKVLGDELLTICKETGADSLKTQFGTATRKIHERYWTNDWASMYQIIKEFEVPELLEKRIHQTNIKQFLEEHPDHFPPGLNVDREYIISVRRKT